MPRVLQVLEAHFSQKGRGYDAYDLVRHGAARLSIP